VIYESGSKVPRRSGSADVEVVLRNEVVALLRKRGVRVLPPIGETTSLVEDVGLDSLSLVDFGLRIERAFGIGDLPLQDWVYEEAQRTSGGYTFGSLVRFVKTHAVVDTAG
jgi:acyl carrier protein